MAPLASLLVALVFQVSAGCPQATRAAAQTDTGWSAYRRGSVAEAVAHFVEADSLCPGDHATQVGLGFVRLRQNQPRAAAERCRPAIESDARCAYAWCGPGPARRGGGRRAAPARGRAAPGRAPASRTVAAPWTPGDMH